MSYPWRQRHFGDVKILTRETSAQRGNKLVDQELIMV